MLRVEPSEAHEAPEFTIPLKNVEVEGFEKPLTLQCKVSGKPLPQLTWYHNKEALSNSAHCTIIHQGQAATLKVHRLNDLDLGTYVCKAKNAVGQATSSCEVSFKAKQDVDDRTLQKPAFYVPLKNLDIIQGSDAMLECVISAVPGKKLKSRSSIMSSAKASFVSRSKCHVVLE